MENRILFIENEEKVAESKKIFQEAGFEILSTDKSDQAFNIIYKNVPDVIVTDTGLTTINGYEFCKKLKTDLNSKEIPLIVLSDHRKMEDAYLYVGVQEFLVKPIDAIGLREKISRQINKAINQNLKKCKVLIHNINQADAHKAQELLVNDGHWLIETSPTAADLMFKVMTFKPDVVLVDLFMGDAPAEEVIKSIRSFTKMRNTVILMYYSARPKSEDDMAFQAKILEIRFMREACQEAGSNAYIGPMSADTFTTLLNEYRTVSFA